MKMRTPGCWWMVVRRRRRWKIDYIEDEVEDRDSDASTCRGRRLEIVTDHHTSLVVQIQRSHPQSALQSPQASRRLGIGK